MEIKFHSSNGNWFDRGIENVRAFVYENYCIEPHDHDFYEINIVLHGSGKHVIEGNEISVSKGDVFVIPPQTVHSYYDTDWLDVYHILIHNDYMMNNREEAQKIPGFLEFTEIEPFLRTSASSSMILHLSQNKLQELISELSLIEDGGAYDTQELAPLKMHTALKIIYSLSYALYQQLNNDQKKSQNKYEYAIIMVLEFIHKNYAEKITVDTLYKMTYLSRSTFLRSFMQICSCTPMEYLNRYRCKKAKELLEAGGYSKTEIAHRCGFYDLSHMERNFKKYK
jgi:AraC family L-rhamnose operon transcriptional activator RhaR/AraC family L-rhamnose operon regulatory protein RhaS